MHVDAINWHTLNPFQQHVRVVSHNHQKKKAKVDCGTSMGHCRWSHMQACLSRALQVFWVEKSQANTCIDKRNTSWAPRVMLG